MNMFSWLLASLTAVELNYGTVFCFKCRDYIYDAELDQISREIDQQVVHKQFFGEQNLAYATVAVYWWDQGYMEASHDIPAAVKVMSSASHCVVQTMCLPY